MSEITAAENAPRRGYFFLGGSETITKSSPIVVRTTLHGYWMTGNKEEEERLADECRELNRIENERVKEEFRKETERRSGL